MKRKGKSRKIRKGMKKESEKEKRGRKKEEGEGGYNM